MKEIKIILAWQMSKNEVVNNDKIPQKESIYPFTIKHLSKIKTCLHKITTDAENR